MMRMPGNCLRRARTGWEKKSVMAFVKRGAHGLPGRALGLKREQPSSRVLLAAV